MKRPAHFPSPDHPLIVAARYNDALAEEHGIEKVVNDLGLSISDVVHIANQRAVRMVLIQAGRLAEIERIQAKGTHEIVKLTDEQQEQVVVLSSLFIDAMLLGWRAHGYAQQESQED